MQSLSGEWRSLIGELVGVFAVPAPPCEQAGSPELRVRLKEGADNNWMYGTPRDVGHDSKTFKEYYEFEGDIRTLTKNFQLVIEPVTWINHLSRDYSQPPPPFEPKWSILLDLEQLVLAREIDAR